MATLYKRGGNKAKNGTWYIQYRDENGRRKTHRGCSDKEATTRIARKLETDAALRKSGVIDPKAERYASEGRRPIAEHIDDFHKDMLAREVTIEHSNRTRQYITRVFSLSKTRTLSDITPSAIQAAVGGLRKGGLSPKSCNDILTAVKQFCRWLRKDGRARHPLWKV